MRRLEQLFACVFVRYIAGDVEPAIDRCGSGRRRLALFKRDPLGFERIGFRRSSDRRCGGELDGVVHGTSRLPVRHGAYVGKNDLTGLRHSRGHRRRHACRWRILRTPDAGEDALRQAGSIVGSDRGDAGALRTIRVVVRPEKACQQVRRRPRSRPFFGVGQALSGGLVRRGVGGRDQRRPGGALRSGFGLGERQLVARKRLAVARDMQRLSVREHLGQLRTGHARPVADTAGIHVHEGGAGFGIVANAAHLFSQAGGTQRGEIDAGNKEVHCLAERVLAALGNALGAAPEHVVRCRRAVAGHHVDRLLPSDLLIDFPDKIEQGRIDLGHFVTAPVAQEAVRFAQAGRYVATVLLERDRYPLLGMQVIEVQRPSFGLGIGNGKLGNRERKKQTHQCQRALQSSDGVVSNKPFTQ